MSTLSDPVATANSVKSAIREMDKDLSPSSSVHGSGRFATNPMVMESVVGAGSQKSLLLSSFLATAALTLST
jgi:hypothetical protein